MLRMDYVCNAWWVVKSSIFSHPPSKNQVVKWKYILTQAKDISGTKVSNASNAQEVITPWTDFLSHKKVCRWAADQSVPKDVIHAQHRDGDGGRYMKYWDSPILDCFFYNFNSNANFILPHRIPSPKSNIQSDPSHSNRFRKCILICIWFCGTK